jgi:hypothetical protein
MEIVDVLVSFFSALLGGVTSLWVAKKVMFSRQNIMESVDSVLEYALNTVEGQMKVKAVMEKISEGLLKGSGLGGRGSKPKLQDIIISLALQYAQSHGILGTGSDGVQNQQLAVKKPWEQ